jgi:hypothetical protein
MKRISTIGTIAATGLLLWCVSCGPHKASIHEIVMDKENILKNGEPYTGEVWSEDGKSFCLTTRNGEPTKFVMYHLNGQEAVRIDNLSDDMTVYDETGAVMPIDSFAILYEDLAGTLQELFPHHPDEQQ